MQVYIVDCETQPFDGKRKVYSPLCWGVYWRSNSETVFRVFEKTPELVGFIRNNPGLYYAHNGGKFDWFFLQPYIGIDGDNSDLLFINGRLAKATIGDSELRDSYSILPFPLRAYKKDDFDYAKLQDYKKNREEIHAYLFHDCENLAELVYHFIETYGTKLTLAGSAMQFWRKQNNIKTAELKTDNGNYDGFFRQFYFGGRCQSNYKGEYTGTFHCWDIKSAYPYAMLHNHPWGFATEYGSERDIVGHSFVKIRTTQTNGAFPFRTRTGGLDFPNDCEEREYCITGWEFLAARELGLLGSYRILLVRTHTKTIDFKKYVRHFYALKRDSKKGTPEYVTAKLLMNSLYGKFAQQWGEFKEYRLFSPDNGIEVNATMPDGSEKVFTFVSQFNAQCGLYEAKADKGKWYNTAIAASITGFVRAYLLKAICNSKGFLYCDTDSIFARQFSGTIGVELGQWEKEGTYSHGYFCGKKLYYADSQDSKRWPDKYAHKGVRLTRSDYARLVRGERITFRFQSPSISIRRNALSYVERQVAMT